MKRIDPVRSVPPSTLMDVTSIRDQSSTGRGSGSRPSARSRMKVVRPFLHAFQYRWNCRSVTVLRVMLRQMMISDPVTVRVAASRRASIV